MEPVTTPEELQNWRDNPITKHMFSELKEKRDDWVNHIAAGHTLNDNTTARVVGQIAGIERSVLIIDDLAYEVSHAES
jgi:hypothetical protein